MAYDPLMRWETEGGALGVTDGRQAATAKVTSWDQADPRHIEPEDRGSSTPASSRRRERLSVATAEEAQYIRSPRPIAPLRWPLRRWL